MSDDSQYERICRAEFAALHAKLDRLDEAIRGNGKLGLQVRLDRLEQDAARKAKLIWLLAGAAITSAASVIVALLTK